MTVARRHLAIYATSLAGGGAERVAAVLAAGFRARGHDVVLIVDFEAGENRHLIGPDIDLVVLGGGHLRSAMRLARLLRARRPDVLLSVSVNTKAAVARLLSLSPTQLVLSYHGTSKLGGGWIGWSSYPGAPLLTRYAARTVAVSDYIARHLEKDWGAAPGRIMRIHNPVQIERAHPADAAELAARPPVVIGMGRLTPVKGFDTLIRAFAQLPDPATRLVIYGDGPEREALRGLAAQLGVGDRVELPGYVANAWKVYAAARCFVLSSRDEAFGNVLVEALASGLPVVATDCGGPAEILDKGRFGTLVPVDEPAALAAAVAAALRQPGNPQARIARATAFSTSAVIARYEALFEEVLSAGRPR